jgi:hypothetical protein
MRISVVMLAEDLPVIVVCVEEYHGKLRDLYLYTSWGLIVLYDLEPLSGCYF